MFTRLAGWCRPIYESRALRIAVATFFSVGKILSSAGSTLFGLKETLNAYGADDKVSLGVSSSLTVLNIVLTTGNRAPPIYRRLLKRRRAAPPTYQALDEPLSDSAIDPTLMRNDLLPVVQATPVTAYLPLSQAPPTTSLSVAVLSQAGKVAFYGLTSFCYLSLPFSALNAYLSAITLINEVYPDLPVNDRLAFASFVTASSMMSYCTFNLAKMQRHVLRFCAAFDYRMQHGTFGIHKYTWIATLLTTVFGIIAGMGTSFLGTQKSLDLFPLTQDLSAETKNFFIGSSVMASLFSSVFVFAFSCYDQVKAYLEPSDRLVTEHFQIPWYVHVMTLLDSISNSTTGFIGITRLLSQLLKQSPNNPLLICIGIPPLLNNIFMNYSLGLLGLKPTLEWLQGQMQRLVGCCRTDSALSQAVTPAAAVISTVGDIEQGDAEPVQAAALSSSTGLTGFFWNAEPRTSRGRETSTRRIEQQPAASPPPSPTTGYRPLTL